MKRAPEGYLLAIGNELLTGDQAESNSQIIQHLLLDRGLEVHGACTVRDDPAAIAEAVVRATDRADFVICTGGLGPTVDDLTREGVARAAGIPLVEDPEALESIRLFFRERGLTLSSSNRRQALIPEGAGMIRNPVGTAPAFVVEIAGIPVYCLPGVPVEMRTLMERVLVDLEERLGAPSEPLFRTRIQLIGLSESSVNDQITDILAAEDPVAGITVRDSLISLCLASRGEKGRQLLTATEGRIRGIFGDRVVSVGEARRLETVLGELLIKENISFALAESCTGGLISHLMTGVPGISSVFWEGVVAYSGEAKTRTLGVPRALMEAHGQVSDEVARAMALGVAQRAGARAGLGITGIAGPGGGTPEKPVGLVQMAACLDGRVRSRRLVFSGDRDSVKRRSAYQALDLLRRTVLGLDEING